MKNLSKKQVSINDVVKIIIVPDIHNDYHTAKKIIKKENPDKIIFLGDYFDDFDDTIQDAENTAKWLKKSLKQENRIHLIGNHDLNYMTDNTNLKCAGYRIDIGTQKSLEKLNRNIVLN